MKWNGIKIEVTGRTEDSEYPIIKLLEPFYIGKDHKKRVYDIGTEIVITDRELMNCSDID